MDPAHRDHRRQRLLRLALVLGYLGVAALRLGLSTRLPAETTDILRNVGYGHAFWSFGLSVYDRTPAELDPCTRTPTGPCAASKACAPEGSAFDTSKRCWSEIWPNHSFDYPIVALLFYAAVAGVSTSLIVARAALGAVELANALLVARLTRSRALGLAYFASPASLWWVSHEGQFEPVAVLFMLLGLHALRTERAPLAYAWLALAVQVKLFPVLLLPSFLLRARRPAGLLAFALGFLPSAVAFARCTYIRNMWKPGYWASGFNPFAWATWKTQPFVWMPRPLVIACGVLAGFLVAWTTFVLVRALVRRDLRRAADALPLLVFLIVLRSASWAQFWYVLLVPAFALNLERPEDYLPAFLAALGEPRAASALVVGPVGLGQWFPLEPYLHGGV